MKFHDTLNEKLFNIDTMEMLPEVKEKLEEIAEAFIEFLEIPTDAILDKVITGSSASYNYNKYSDLDLHIIVDYDKVHEDCPLVNGYLNSLKKQFNDNHDITIHGVPVELYAEQKDQGTVHNGLYSLQTGWIDKPQKIEPTDNDAAVEAKFNEIKELVDKCDDSEEATELLEKIYNMRKAGLAEAGEFCTENLAFKKLRNEGCMDKLRQIKKEQIDKQLSLESYNEDNTLKDIIDRLINIGLQIDGSYKDYKPSEIKYAKEVMDIAVKKGFVFKEQDQYKKEISQSFAKLRYDLLNDKQVIEIANKAKKDIDKQLSLESYNEDFQKLSRDDFKIIKTENGYFKVDGGYDSRIGYIEPSKNIWKVDRALGNAIYKYNTKFIQEDRKALISKLHKLFKQAGIPKMKDMTTSIRGYRPITQNGYYIDIYRGDRTCFHIGTTGSKEEEWANKIKEILNNEGVKYTGSVDYFTVDMEKQDNKNESIKESKSYNEEFNTLDLYIDGQYQDTFNNEGEINQFLDDNNIDPEYSKIEIEETPKARPTEHRYKIGDELMVANLATRDVDYKGPLKVKIIAYYDSDEVYVVENDKGETGTIDRNNIISYIIPKNESVKEENEKLKEGDLVDIYCKGQTRLSPKWFYNMTVETVYPNSTAFRKENGKRYVVSNQDLVKVKFHTKNESMNEAEGTKYVEDPKELTPKYKVGDYVRFYDSYDQTNRIGKITRINATEIPDDVVLYYTSYQIEHYIPKGVKLTWGGKSSGQFYYAQRVAEKNILSLVSEEEYQKSCLDNAPQSNDTETDSVAEYVFDVEYEDTQADEWGDGFTSGTLTITKWNDGTYSWYADDIDDGDEGLKSIAQCKKAYKDYLKEGGFRKIRITQNESMKEDYEDDIEHSIDFHNLHNELWDDWYYNKVQAVEKEITKELKAAGFNYGCMINSLGGSTYECYVKLNKEDGKQQADTFFKIALPKLKKLNIKNVKKNYNTTDYTTPVAEILFDETLNEQTKQQLLVNKNESVNKLEETLKKVKDMEINEGMWASPFTMENAKQIAELLAKPITYEELNSEEGKQKVWNIIGDDEFWDNVADEAFDNPEEDARYLIVKFLEDWMERKESFNNDAYSQEAENIIKKAIFMFNGITEDMATLEKKVDAADNDLHDIITSLENSIKEALE